MMLIDQLIIQYGFPITMCMWFMFKSDKTLQKNTDALNNLILIIKERLN